MLMARAVARPRSLHPPGQSRSADASRTRVETPQVESAGIEPVKSEPARSEGASELRRSTD
jgi:hypothetical protein